MALRGFIRTILDGMKTSTPKKMPTTFDHATGSEKIMMLAKQAGDMDPFLMLPIQRGEGTKEQPTTVPSRCEARVFGCLCTPEQPIPRFFWLVKGESKRCFCGHWYKLVEAKPLPELTYEEDDTEQVAKKAAN